MAVHLNWSLPTQSSLAFLHRTFHKAPAPPRLLSILSQKLSSGSGDPFLSNASGFGPRKSANLDRPDALIGSSGSSSSSSSSSSAIDFLELCLRFMTKERKGWINRGLQDPESIADYIYRFMAMTAGDLHGVNRERCIKIAIVHDIVEAIVGDKKSYHYISEGEMRRWKQSALREMHKVFGGQMTVEEFKELWEEYENNSSLEANLVKDFEKVEPILQALEYEMEHGKVLAVLDAHFLSLEGKFQTEIGKSWAAEITSRRNSWLGNCPN
ncbi:5'-deoxynucleotidase HDDC2-like isoform X2 [Vitis riparia]|uniref:5'-deoxynucleotidase HDDC2-like isoform X2 n=1 Tax=Vitis riparia TaxID=96939 RepID=UPI00155B1EC5|nr:5'-deoxynucleotidase HDDC2-like isoform X2 [Vitis riparia]